MTGLARAWDRCALVNARAGPVHAKLGHVSVTSARRNVRGLSPGQSMAPLYGLEPGPSGEVRDRCVRLNGLEPGRIPVGAFHRAAARATPTHKKREGGTEVPPNPTIAAGV